MSSLPQTTPSPSQGPRGASRAGWIAPLAVAALLAPGRTAAGQDRFPDAQNPPASRADAPPTYAEQARQAEDRLTLLRARAALPAIEAGIAALRASVDGMSDELAWVVQTKTELAQAEKLRDGLKREEASALGRLPADLRSPTAADEQDLIDQLADYAGNPEPQAPVPGTGWGKAGIGALGVLGLTAAVYGVARALRQRKNGKNGARPDVDTHEQETQAFERSAEPRGTRETTPEAEPARPDLAAALGALADYLPAGEGVRIWVENASVLLWRKPDVTTGKNVVPGDVLVARGTGEGTRGVTRETGGAKEGDEELPQSFGQSRSCDAAWAARALEEGSQDPDPEGLAALTEEVMSMATLLAGEKRVPEARQDA